MTHFYAKMTMMQAAVIVLLAGSAAGQTDTTFTYQGELRDNGEPANGPFNIDFALWDSLSAGTQVGSQIMFNGLAVVDGVFTVELDFTAAVFDGDPLWLEITVNGGELVPRQPLTGSPYSVQTRGIFVSANKNVGIGTMTPEGPLHVREGSAGNVTAWADSIAVLERSGHGYLSILSPEDTERGIFFGDVASNVNGGIIYNNAAMQDGFQFRTQNQTRMVIDNDGCVGIGSTVPDSSALYVNSDQHIVAIHAETDLGHAVHATNKALSGITKGILGQTWSTSGAGVTGESLAASGTTYGVIGTTHSPSGYDFYANGAGTNYGASSSRRWKHQVRRIDDALGKMAQLRGVYFNWDAEHGGHHDVGMIAEEVGAVLPEIVQYEENGVDASGMDYSKMTPLLVEAVNALRVENESLRERLQSLEDLVTQKEATQLEESK